MRQTRPSSSPLCNVLIRNGQGILVAFYVCTVGLCIYMVFWIMVLPASWLVGHVEGYDEWLANGFLKKVSHVLAPEIILKYKDHGLIQILHTLPGAAWAAILPFQLHSTWRKQHGRLHRISGYIFAASSISMSLGLVVIFQRKVLFKYDFAELPPFEPTFPIDLVVVPLAFWFPITLAMAIHKARCKNFKSHKVHVLRHVGSGMWVALQRVLIAIRGELFGPYSRTEQRQLFSDSAFHGIFISIIASELAIWILKEQGKKRGQDE